MKLKLDRQVCEGVWFDYTTTSGEVSELKFFLKPVGYPDINKRMPSDIEDEKEKYEMMQWVAFDLGLCNWKGVIDENDDECPCNEDTKFVFFNHHIDLRIFVSEKLAELQDRVVKEIKN